MSSRKGVRARSTGLALLLALIAGCAGCGGGSTTGQSPFPSGPTSGPTTSTAVTEAPPVAATPSPTPLPSVLTRPSVPLVPVAGFWSSRRAIALADLSKLLGGDITSISPKATRVLVDRPDATELGRSLGVTIGASVEIADAAQIKAAVRADSNAVGIVRADDVTPDVRALALGTVSLFGSGRVKTLAEWPLNVPSDSPSAFDPGRVWTLAAGGDVNFERFVYSYAVLKKRGVDYPWAGGYATITGRVCCGFGRNLRVVARRSGGAGAVSDLLSEADLTLVNLEGPAPNHFVFHPDGLVFSFDPKMLAGMRNVGIDGVTIANNHIRNAGLAGVRETVANLDAIGIKHAGAGQNLAAADRPAMFTAGGLSIAVLAYDQIPGGGFATSTKAGAVAYSIGRAVADIKAARAAGADFVIVMPHWGAEYSLKVSQSQRRDAAAMVAAGADAILGSHSHVTGAIEAIPTAEGGQAFVVYSLGDLLFDLNYSEATQEGVVANLTYVGRRLVQIDLRPTVMVDRSQINLLDPAGDGKVVLDRIRSASKATLRY